MAKSSKKPVLLPPSPEAREQVLTVIRSTAKPLPAKDIAKLLVAPYGIAEKQLVPILDEYVAAGTLRKFPGKSATAKPFYWDRDAGAITRAAILEASEHADEPFAAKEILGRLVVPLPLNESSLTEILQEFAAAGKLHGIPPKSAKAKTAKIRFWNRDLLEFGRRTILKTLDTKGPQSEANLKKAAAGLDETQFQQILQNAIAARDIWRHPPIGKTGKDLFGKQPPSPELYLREVEKQLTTVIARLVAANVPLESLRRALVQVIEAAGVPFASAAVSNREVAAVSPSSAVDLIGLIRRIEPGADRGALVGSRDLRRAARIDKFEFDRAVLNLARQERLSLHRHDYPASLSPAERDELVTDGKGTYYVGMALRQNSGRPHTL